MKKIMLIPAFAMTFILGFTFKSITTKSNYQAASNKKGNRHWWYFFQV